MALAAIVGLRPRPGASLSPSRPLAAQRFLQRPMAKRLTPCSRDISSWLSPLGQPQDDPGPEDLTLSARLGRHDALEFALLFRGHLDRNGGRHNAYDATTCVFMQSYLRDITLAMGHPTRVCNLIRATCKI